MKLKKVTEVAAVPLRLVVATFNIRNITDRYAERRPLLVSAFAAIAPDLAGLQEVVFHSPGPELPRQDDLLAAAVPSRVYRSLEAQSPRHPGFGNAILAATGQVLAHETLPLSEGRIAQRALVTLPGQRTLWFGNTHLHHTPGHTGIRQEQVEAICDWMDGAPAATATVLVGDFNAPPFEPAYSGMQGRGFRSAFAEANGVEPAVTWPSGIQAPTMDTEGDPNCLDYIWLRGDVKVRAAQVAANQSAADDPTLFPSDHFAVVAELEL